MENLQKDFSEIISKNLPQMVGDELKDFIAKAKKEQKEYELAKIEIKRLEEILSITREELNKLESLENLIEEKRTYLEQIELKERNLEITTLKLQLEESNKRADIVKELVHVVFKNPTFKTIEQHSGMIPVEHSYTDSYGHTNKNSIQMPTSYTVEKETIQVD